MKPMPANGIQCHIIIYLLSMMHIGCMLCFGRAGVIISLVCISLVFYIGTTYHKVHACLMYMDF